MSQSKQEIFFSKIQLMSCTLGAHKNTKLANRVRVAQMLFELGETSSRITLRHCTYFIDGGHFPCIFILVHRSLVILARRPLHSFFFNIFDCPSGLFYSFVKRHSVYQSLRTQLSVLKTGVFFQLNLLLLYLWLPRITT